MNELGYGVFRLGGGRNAKAHRFAYEALVGPIPKGLRDLDHRHTCPKNCVNPAHLRPVPHKKNQENRAGAQRNSSTGVRGVSPRRGRFIVQVVHNGQVYRGGLFNDVASAEVAAIGLRNKLFTHNDADREATG